MGILLEDIVGNLEESVFQSMLNLRLQGRCLKRKDNSYWACMLSLIL
jgi:hypothetical protein